MSLRETAHQDLTQILSDSAGFAWDIVLTSPAGSAASLKGFTADIGQSIDPETGQAVVGRMASVAISMDALESAGIGSPKGVFDQTSKPWRVTFDDVQGSSYTYKVQEAMPDRTLGIVTCMLEAYGS